MVTAIFAFYLIRFTDVKLTLLVPFSHGYYWNIGWVAVPLLFVAVIGTVNGVNFTDGLDGLASVSYTHLDVYKRQLLPSILWKTVS